VLLLLLPLVVGEELLVVVLVSAPIAAVEAKSLVVPDDKGAAPYSITTIPSSDWTDEVQIVLEGVLLLAPRLALLEMLKLLLPLRAVLLGRSPPPPLLTRRVLPFVGALLPLLPGVPAILLA
jgi:hypothetical protein